MGAPQRAKGMGRDRAMLETGFGETLCSFWDCGRRIGKAFSRLGLELSIISNCMDFGLVGKNNGNGTIGKKGVYDTSI